MLQALLIRLRPSGPWRYGPADGALDRLDTLYRSDRLFSALTLAMRQLGLLDTWLDATARAERPAVAFSSLFPFQGDTLFVTPPAHLWPPPSSLVTSPSPVFLTKVRWRAAHFIPLSLVDSLLTGQPVLADQWIPDPESGCLLRRDRPSSSPFRTVTRASAAVDRLRLTAADAESSACVEFEAGSGLWTAIRFADDEARAAWVEPLRSAFRLLADTGFGGGRSKGWGQVQTLEFESGTWPSILLPKLGRAAKNDAHEEQTARSYWLMSLYSPAATDKLNWSGGQYELAVRNGRVEGSSGALKKSIRMVVEGCILEATSEPVGTAIDVAPEGMSHPVYRSGIALSLLLPLPKPQSEDRRAIEEIVPPELEATPFPMPPPVVEEPEVTPQPVPEPEPVTLSLTHSELMTEEPGYEPAIEEPETTPGEPPFEDPRYDPSPEEDPEEEPWPVEDPPAEPDPAPVEEPAAEAKTEEATEYAATKAEVETLETEAPPNAHSEGDDEV